DLASVLEFVRQHNIEIAGEPRAKKLTLAYPIKKHKEAVFAYCTVRALGEDIKNLEHDLNTNPEVIRSLITNAVSQLQEDRQSAAFAAKRRTRVLRPGPPAEAKPAAPKPLSNEALEKKIEEILQ